MVGQAWRLTYTDSGGTKRIIAELGQQTGAKNIDRIYYQLNRKNPWKMKVFADPSLLKAFPNELTEYQGSEPEILFEEYDGSWTVRGRFYSASQANDEDEFAIKLLDFYHKLMKQQVTVSNTSTHVVDVLEKALPSGYVVDAPAEGDVSGGYPSVDSYSAQQIQRRKVFREVTRNYNWSLFFLPETDSNGNWKVRFEPDGFGGTVETLDSSTDNFQFKTWKPPTKENLVTKTFVEGVNSNGTKITATAENTTIRDKYLGTNAEDHNFESFKVGYLESQSEADQIAANRLVPGPDATSVKESGKISNIIYPQDVVNDSFGLIDNFRGIDDTFTCVKQENFYPVNQSYLHFEFESEKLEKAAENEENLRDERERLYTQNNVQKNVGAQSLETGGTGFSRSDNSTSEDDKSPPTSGDTGFALGDGNYVFEEAGATVTDTASVSVSDTVPNLSTFVEYALITANVSFNGTAGDIDIVITNNSTGDTYFNRTFNLVQDNTTRTVVALERASVDGDTIQTEVTNNTGSSAEISVDQSVDVIGQHDHTTSGSTDAHNHAVSVTDGGHGGATIDNIIAVDTSNNIFTVSDDETADYSSSNTRKDDIRVRGSTGNDGDYTVSNVALNGSGNTEITVNENVSDSTADGVIIPEENHGLTGQTLDQILDFITTQEEKTSR